jgi:hypothetical protein
MNKFPISVFGVLAELESYSKNNCKKERKIGRV